MKHAPGCWPRKRGQHVGNVLGGVKRVQYISPVSARVASIVSPASEAAPPAMVEDNTTPMPPDVVTIH
jgi:hypothetical protein